MKSDGKTLDRILRLSRALTPDEKIACMKALANQVGVKLYTEKDVQGIVESAVQEYQRLRQREAERENFIRQFNALRKP